MRRTSRSAQRRAFSIVELLVVVGIIAILIGILLPTLGSARSRSRALACGANLKQLGTATQQHLLDNREHLPQMQVDDAGFRVPIGDPMGSTIGPLFAGKVGLVQAFGINRYGAASRPLNPYLGVRNAPTDPSDSDSAEVIALRREFQIDALNSPVDRGVTGLSPTEMGMTVDDGPALSSMYEMMGTSYILNDHAIGGDSSGEPTDERPTLVPCNGGQMPRVRTPDKTWLLGTYTMYNYDQGRELGMNWFSRNKVEANILFADLHLATTVPVAGPTSTDLALPFPGGPDWDLGSSGNIGPEGTNVTRNYTFLPEERWFELDEGQPCP